jgi:hypothetical protein
MQLISFITAPVLDFNQPAQDIFYIPWLLSPSTLRARGYANTPFVFLDISAITKAKLPLSSVGDLSLSFVCGPRAICWPRRLIKTPFVLLGIPAKRQEQSRDCFLLSLNWNPFGVSVAEAFATTIGHGRAEGCKEIVLTRTSSKYQSTVCHPI